MAASVVFSNDARRDLLDLYAYIRDRSSPVVARGYIDRIRDFCRELSTFPKRGMSRSDLGEGVRIVGFERSASIVFKVAGAQVIILGIFYRGRSISLD